MHEQEAYRNLRHNVRINTIQGIFAVLAQNLTAPFLPLFAIKVLEASDSQVAWLSSLPALTGILVLLPGALFIDRLVAKKKFTGTMIYLRGLFFLFLATLPFLSLDLYWMAWLFVLLVGLMNIPFSVYQLSWQAFIADVIPASQRARVFGMRNRITQGIGTITTVLTGLLIYWYGGAPWAYQTIFALSFVVGMLEASTLIKIKEPMRTVEKKGHSLWELLQAVRREQRFLIFAAASAVFHFGWQMAWPLFNIYQMSPDYANMSALWVSVITVCNSLMGVLTYPWWGKVAQKIGHGWTLCIGTAGLATAPLLYALTMNLWMLAAFNLWMGIFVACTVQTLFNRVLEVSPDDKRALFIAMHSLVIGLTAIIAPQFGVWVMGLFDINVAFYISSGIRLLGSVALGLVVLWEIRRRRAGRL
ncbi:MFS transporter [Tumebacillus lipolyticus]|uniref:MFS transporter n=1 Tax=Tumebacillus lipolyticus TaxID=1280370 RepID=A0ABW4ZZM4_9BACL